MLEALLTGFFILAMAGILIGALEWFCDHFVPIFWTCAAVAGVIWLWFTYGA